MIPNLCYSDSSVLTSILEVMGWPQWPPLTSNLRFDLKFCFPIPKNLGNDPTCLIVCTRAQPYIRQQRTQPPRRQAPVVAGLDESILMRLATDIMSNVRHYNIHLDFYRLREELRRSYDPSQWTSMPVCLVSPRQLLALAFQLFKFWLYWYRPTWAISQPNFSN